MKKLLTLILFLYAISTALEAQSSEDYDAYHEQPVSMPCTKCIVSSHKDQLKLTLAIDSIEFSDKTIKANFNKTVIMGFESDYLKINDSLYLKIFIARNQEYGKKFYTWTWDYLKKRGEQFFSMGKGFYNEIEYGTKVPLSGNTISGLGTYGTPNYIIYHYHYLID